MGLDTLPTSSNWYESVIKGFSPSFFSQYPSEMPPLQSSTYFSMEDIDLTQNRGFSSPEKPANPEKGKEVEITPEMSLSFIEYAMKRFDADFDQGSVLAASSYPSSSYIPAESSLRNVPTASTSASSVVSSRRSDKPLLPVVVNDPTDLVAMKRARNTLAARKGRERRAQRLEEMEEKIEALEAERNDWKEVAKGQDRIS